MKDELKKLQQEYNTDELIESVVKVCDKLSDEDKDVILKLMDYGTALEMIILREKENESKRTRVNNKE
jgi:hypothetical protein